MDVWPFRRSWPQLLCNGWKRYLRGAGSWQSNVLFTLSDVSTGCRARRECGGALGVHPSGWKYRGPLGYSQGGEGCEELPNPSGDTRLSAHCVEEEEGEEEEEEEGEGGGGGGGAGGGGGGGGEWWCLLPHQVVAGHTNKFHSCQTQTVITQYSCPRPKKPDGLFDMINYTALTLRIKSDCSALRLIQRRKKSLPNDVVPLKGFSHEALPVRRRQATPCRFTLACLMYRISLWETLQEVWWLCKKSGGSTRSLVALQEVWWLCKKSGGSARSLVALQEVPIDPGVLSLLLNSCEVRVIF